jgi:hypothetical protein
MGFDMVTLAKVVFNPTIRTYYLRIRASLFPSVPFTAGSGAGKWMPASSVSWG